MRDRRFNPEERQGISAVDRIVSNELKWIWREQPVADFGVDGHIEVVDDDGTPTGRLIAVQVKSGGSYFRVNESTLHFYPDHVHMKYWDQHSLRTILVLHNPVTEETIWQWANLKTARSTKAGWCIDVPRSNHFNGTIKAELNDESWKNDSIALRMRFAMDYTFMKQFESKDAFVVIDKWLNKHLQYREIKVYFSYPENESADFEVPIMVTWEFEVVDIMRHFLPWLDFDYYDEPNDGGTGEVERHLLSVTLSKAAKAYLELEQFFADPWVSENDEWGEASD